MEPSYERMIFLNSVFAYYNKAICFFYPNFTFIRFIFVQDMIICQSKKVSSYEIWNL